MFQKIKNNLKNFMTNKAAFSLVELIVVIAIMAVMAAVLAPALLGYVEKSRMQKDDSALNEVTNAIHLSLADAEVYDEVLKASVKDNYSCYADGDTSTNIDTNKITTKEPDLWLFNDQARLLDETVYKPAGKMRGVTVTLKPNGEAEYILKNGIVNKIGDDTTKKGSLAGKTLVDCPELYNRLRSTVGDTIKVSSQTYRNSDYTIFVSMGTTGGNQADKQDAIKVYGQYNGTNLSEVATPVAGGSQNGDITTEEGEETIAVLDSYGEDSTRTSNVVWAPFILDEATHGHKEYKNKSITALKIKAQKTGTLSIGRIKTVDYAHGGEFDENNIVERIVLQVNSTGEQTITLPSPIVVTDGEDLFLGHSTDTANIYYGSSTAKDKGYFYKGNGLKTFINQPLALNVIVYATVNV